MDTAKVEEVVGDFVALRRRGVNMIGLCPFHNEKTPSFTVSPSKNLWKCFCSPKFCLTFVLAFGKKRLAQSKLILDIIPYRQAVQRV